MYSTLFTRTLAGANIIVAGTAIFADPSPRDVIQFLRTRCEKAQVKIAKERERILFDPNDESALSEGESESQPPSRAGSRNNSMSQPRAYLRHLVARRSSGQLEPMKRGHAPDGGVPSLAKLTGSMGMTSMN